MKKQVLPFLLTFLLLPTLLWAQERTITGTVLSSEDNQPLPGVNIIVKGTTTGTTTDLNGFFRLSTADNNAVLIFSAIGFLQQELPVGNQTTINLTMQVDVQQLQEVVVTGYGSQVKRDVTGAISQVKSKELTAMKAPSLDAALQGQAAGLQVSSAGGVPGAPVRILVRGTNSLTSGTEPLWVIDGVFINNPVGGFADEQGGSLPQSPLANINPNDIESIEVLKDAAATAIYGSRGSNGVILVTTKSGKGQKGSVNIEFSRGVTDLTRSPEDIGFMSGQEWLQTVDQARANSSLGVFEPNTILNVGRDPNARLTRDQVANTNWFDEILQKGSFSDLNISTSKGGDKMSYFVSGQYRTDDGVMQGNRFQRASLRGNMDFSPVNNLTIGTRLSISYTKNERVRTAGGGTPGGNNQIAFGGFGQANSGALPIFPVLHPTVTNPDGRRAFFDPLSGNNLAVSINRDNLIDDNYQYRGIGSVFAQYDLPWVKGLSLRTEGAVDFVQSNSIVWANTQVRVGSAYAFQDNRAFRNLNYNAYATFNRTFGQHSVSLVGGTEAQRSDGNRMYIEGAQLIGNQQQVGTPVSLLRVGGTMGGGERYILSYFGRANYKFKDRYLFGASLRRDGSSVFTEENRWSMFSALSAGWILSEENFLKSVEFVNLLKVRASFGQTGNQDVDAAATQDGFTGWSRYGSREPGLVGAGDNLSRIGNTSITWETTNAYDVGVDFELFGNRLSGSVAYYRQRVSDLVLQVPIAQSSGIFSGAPTIAANIGDMDNYGMEFVLNAVVIDRAGFRWDISSNLTTNRNKVVSLNPSLDAVGAGINEGNTVTRAGGRLGAFFMNRYAGIDPNTGVELIYALDRDHLAQTQQYRVLNDANGNPVKIPATQANANNNRFLENDKTGLPTYFGGVTNSFGYKGFDLSVMVAFQGGNWLYHNAERTWTNVGTGTNVLIRDMIGNTWTPQNPNAKYPQLRWNYRYDVDSNGQPAAAGSQRYDVTRPLDRYAYKGDFLRLRALTIGYTLPANLTKKVSLERMRVYVVGNNLFTATEFPGYDPEAAALGGSQNRNLGQGFISSQIPQTRSWTVGASLSF